MYSIFAEALFTAVGVRPRDHRRSHTDNARRAREARHREDLSFLRRYADRQS